MKTINRTGYFSIFILLIIIPFHGRSQYREVSPCDPFSTQETISLYRTLDDLRSYGILVGQQDYPFYGVGRFPLDGASDFENVTGIEPSILGVDIGHLELGADRNIDSVSFADMRNEIIRSYRHGQAITISWHARNPVTGGDSWDTSDSTVVRQIITPGNPYHEKFTGWLDMIADFIESLTGEDGEPIPVIFRPYHEMTDAWFWWGDKLCTAGQFTALWQMTVDHLRDRRDLHNIIMSYSSSYFRTVEQFMERYPGDDYVDMVGFDIYQWGGPPARERFLNDLRRQVPLLLEIAEQTGKIPAITEAGFEGIPTDDWFTDTLMPEITGKGLSYILFWRNSHDLPGHFFIPYPGHPAAVDFKRFHESEDVLNKNRVGNLYL